jgi:hypothetical protein
MCLVLSGLVASFSLEAKVYLFVDAILLFTDYFRKLFFD